MEPLAYPARLDGRFDTTTSRWMWLLKPILVIPHVIVLVFLWLAVVVTTFIAGVSILFTTRYPRALFDFNVGVMRWTWRVAFYSFSAFGTDKYPPFTLQHDATFPADFDVDYPQQLSRGLVLVKWWLLALPQLLIVAVFAGGFGMHFGNLIGLLALISVVIYAFKGKYPQEMFDLIMGCNRWCYRVLAYVALMRDEYPPFRLDAGGDDPGHVMAMPPTPAPQPVGAGPMS